ncbi:pilus assembly protein TadG-related protein [Comamonas thiooxydans]|uniref:pilus assembly protein TadG-related protein n=1 Tax=Comamonas thiooxydans TaxID=363952 RepID=UPI001E3CD0AD|nr:Tad domain-containing protein [Comamonas thiooxydans]
MRGSTAALRRQHGAFLITFALFMLFLLGFMGIALDFGRLFVVKTELQTAVDSCALAAAQELDGQSSAITRARSAGMAAGNANNANLQSTSWNGVGKITASDIDIFRDKEYLITTDAKKAQYAECKYTMSSIKLWLLQAMGAFTGDSTTWAGNGTVGARAVATRAPSQTNCLMPIGLCKKPTGSFSPGEWLSGVTNDKDETEASGAFKWLDYTGPGGGANEIKNLLAGNGACNLPGTATNVTDPSKNGKTNGAVDAWNTRFGIYKGSYNQTDNPPDETGYAWYAAKDDASLKKPGRYSDQSSAGFSAKRSVHAPYQGDNQADNKQLNAVNGNGNGNGNGGTDYTKGGSRRIMTVGVVDCGAPKLQLTGFACVLALHPMAKAASGKNEKMWLEYISDASAMTGNPCSTGGLAGTGSNVPLVPTLVR